MSDHSATEPRKRAPYERSEYMETWLSGRKHLTANEAGFKRPPGFESLRLRRERSEQGDKQCGALFRIRSCSEIILEADAEQKYPERVLNM